MAEVNNTAYDPISALNEQNSSVNQSKTNKLSQPGGELGKDAFLQLLVAQMKYQDPLNPMDNSQYLAQLAQFSSLEQMENLNNQFEQYNGHSMIGKYAFAPYQDSVTKETKYVEGVIESVMFNKGKTYVIIDGKDIPIESVQLVEYAITGEDLAKIQQMQANNAFSLIGKYVYGKTLDEDGETVKDVEGYVKQVNLENGKFYLLIDDEKIDFSSIYKVAEEQPTEEEPGEETESGQ